MAITVRCVQTTSNVKPQESAQPSISWLRCCTWTPQLWWCMTWEHVAVATSHKQIWARGVRCPGEGEGREADAIRLPSDDTARQVMLVSCCCRHLHHKGNIAGQSLSTFLHLLNKLVKSGLLHHRRGQACTHQPRCFLSLVNV